MKENLLNFPSPSLLFIQILFRTNKLQSREERTEEKLNKMIQMKWAIKKRLKRIFLIFFTSMKNVYYMIGEIYKNIYI